MIRNLFSRLRARQARDPEGCPICGETKFRDQPVLWPKLIAEWELSVAEAAAIDLQQGRQCEGCKAQLRVMTLAEAIMQHFAWPGLFRDFTDPKGRQRKLRVLEVNEAGHLAAHLARLPFHRLAKYPDVDLQALPFADATFDLVVHSDTLEHIPESARALRECRRVLCSGGIVAYTVPIVVGRMTRHRDELPASFHGGPGDELPDYRVFTEYGADAWRELMDAGFREVRLHAREYPASLALVGLKG